MFLPLHPQVYINNVLCKSCKAEKPPNYNGVAYIHVGFGAGGLPAASAPGTLVGAAVKPEAVV
jgi:hypothetical protein